MPKNTEYIHYLMQIQRLDHISTAQFSIAVRHDTAPRHHNVWHYHEELELINIKKGRGTFFVGDCIHQFSDKFFVLIGSNTPHYWLFDEEYININENKSADIRVIHFKPDYLGKDFLDLPESASIRAVYTLADRVLTFQDDDGDAFSKVFDEIMEQSPLNRLLTLSSLLNKIQRLTNSVLLMNSKYSKMPQQDDYTRMNKILDYIRFNYKIKIHLQEIAQIAGMSPNSFCRYFKQKTGKTLIQFVNELRIGQACKQLSETNASIKEICFDCGFQNFVSFHKIFKSLTAVTPSMYRSNSK